MNSRGLQNLETYNTSPNVRAFGYMIMRAEGTITHGYYTMFGGSRLSSLAAHPNIVLHIGSYYSSAAGAFQFLKDTWAGLKSKLGLTDFSADSQNAAYVELLRETNALQPLLNGDFDTALARCKQIWASLPGSGHGQGERSLSQVKTWFNDALGNDSLLPEGSPEMAISAGTLLLGGLILYLLID